MEEGSREESMSLTAYLDDIEERILLLTTDDGTEVVNISVQ